MSETTNMTNQQRLEIFNDEYRSIVRKYERESQKYTLKMNEDYEYFFRWYGAQMYKATVNLSAIRGLRQIIHWDDLEKSKTLLQHQIENIELTLIEGSQYPTSSSIMINAAEILKREAAQEFRQDLQGLLFIITNNQE